MRRETHRVRYREESGDEGGVNRTRDDEERKESITEGSILTRQTTRINTV